MSDGRDDAGIEQVRGKVIATRTVEERDSKFRRAALNTLEFRALESGEYKLVKVQND